MFDCWKKKRRERSDRTPEIDPQSPTRNISDHRLRYMHPDAAWLPEEDLLGRYKVKYDWDRTVAVVHHTAGWQDRTGPEFISKFLKRGYCTDFIDEKGQIWQQRHGDTTGPHVGKSKFPGVGSDLNNKSIGVEIAAGGKLKLWKPGDSKGKSWSKDYIPEGYEIRTYFNKKVEHPRYVTTDMGYEERGWYEPFTPQQEEALVRWIKHWHKVGIPLDNFVGHDEVAGKKYLGYARKNDPGGSLSLPLAKFIDKYVITNEPYRIDE